MNESLTQLQAIKDTGMKPQEIAVRLKVGVATVYSWLRGVTPREVYQSKIAALWRRVVEKQDQE